MLFPPDLPPWEASSRCYHRCCTLGLLLFFSEMSASYAACGRGSRHSDRPRGLGNRLSGSAMQGPTEAVPRHWAPAPQSRRSSPGSRDCPSPAVRNPAVKSSSGESGTSRAMDPQGCPSCFRPAQTLWGSFPGKPCLLGLPGFYHFGCKHSALSRQEMVPRERRQRRCVFQKEPKAEDRRTECATCKGTGDNEKLVK
ncbi:PHD finger protein 14 [Plecturocebus cupreus]